MAFVSTGDGSVFVFHQDSPDYYSAVQKIATAAGAKTMGYDARSQRIFVPTSQNGAMSIMVFSAK